MFHNHTKHLKQLFPEQSFAYRETEPEFESTLSPNVPIDWYSGGTVFESFLGFRLSSLVSIIPYRYMP